MKAKSAIIVVFCFSCRMEHQAHEYAGGGEGIKTWGGGGMHGEFVENEYYKKKDNPASEQKNPNK